MFSRRQFLLGSVAGLAYLGEFQGDVLAKVGNKRQVVAKGPHILAKNYWSPAISADFVGSLEDGICCIVDQFGRLAIVDLNNPSADKGTAYVLSELSGLGSKVLLFCTYGKRAVALVTKPGKDESEKKLALVLINLAPITAPSVVAREDLNGIAEATHMSISQDLISLCGTSSSGKDLLIVFTIGKGKNPAITQSGSVELESPFDAIDLQDRSVVGLHGGEKSQLSLIKLNNAQTPQVQAALDLEGNYTQLGRYRDLVLVAGQTADKSAELKLVSLRPKPNVVARSALTGARQVTQVLGQKDSFLVLGENSEGPELVTITVDKKALSEQNPLVLCSSAEDKGGARTLAANARVAFVGNGWSGVQIVKLTRSGLSLGAGYTIPRLPASGLASWGDLVVLASADLKLYDISQPTKPGLLKVTSPESAIKAITGAGSFVLCLSKDEVQLRKFEALETVITSHSVSGRQLCFDSVQKIAYIVRDENKKTIAQQLKTYSNALVDGLSLDVGPSYSRVFADGGELLVGGLNDISLYSVSEGAQLVGSRHFENLAVRDFSTCGDYIYVTAIDQQSRGFFLVLSKDKGELKSLGNIDLPHDGAALAVANDIVVATGRTPDGKDLLSIIKITSPSSPKIETSLPALESAAFVSLKKDLAIVAGRGLEIVSLV
jgi:hypothetical protein